MTDLTLLREKLISLRRRTLALLAERSDDEVTDAGLIGLVANVRIAIQALEEKERREL